MACVERLRKTALLEESRDQRVRLGICVHRVLPAVPTPAPVTLRLGPELDTMAPRRMENDSAESANLSVNVAGSSRQKLHLAVRQVERPEYGCAR